MNSFLFKENIVSFALEILLEDVLVVHVHVSTDVVDTSG